MKTIHWNLAMDLHPRLGRELQTIRAMIDIYCADHHARAVDGYICSDCKTLYEYAAKRLQRCPFQHHKPTCGNCSIHCYREEMRENVRSVMRYSGPKMIRAHPILAVLHLLDGFKNPPKRHIRLRTVKDPATIEESRTGE